MTIQAPRRAAQQVDHPDDTSRPVRRNGGLGDLLRGLWADRSGRMGLLIVAVFVFVALFAPVVAPYHPLSRLRLPDDTLARLLPPSFDHPFGTTNYGRDIFSQVIWGTRRSLSVGFVAALMAVFIGTNVGLLAGYVGGRIDTVLMRLVDIAYALPFLPLAIVAVGIIGRNDLVLVGVIAALFWRTTARIVRAQTLMLKEKPFVKAALIGGASSWRTMYIHLLPNLIPLAVLYGVLLTVEAVMAEASLSFLGFAPPDSMSWGTVMFDAFTSQQLEVAWWWPLFPGLAIMLLVSALSMLGGAYERTVLPRTATRRRPR